MNSTWPSKRQINKQILSNSIHNPQAELIGINILSPFNQGKHKIPLQVLNLKSLPAASHSSYA